MAASDAAAYSAVNPPNELPAITQGCPVSSFTYDKQTAKRLEWLDMSEFVVLLRKSCRAKK